MQGWRSSSVLGVDGLEFVDLDLGPPDDRHLVVDVRAAALNFSDLLMSEDKYQVRPPRPFTPGQEIAGTVVSAPRGSHWNVGDRIASKIPWGGFAEQALVPCDSAFLIPENFSFELAAALPVTYTTSMVAFFDSTKLKSDQTVMVHAAAGGVGLAAVEIAKAIGARVIATASNAHKLDIAREHGADVCINYSDENWVEAVKDATSGLGVDVIYDPVGGDVGLQSLRCLARNGVILIVGFASGTITEIPANRLMLKRASAKGVYWHHDHDADLIKKMMDKMFVMLEKDLLKPLVDRRFDLAQLPDAMRALQNRDTTGKVVLAV
ncbi:NADPH:quinone oxidoreductase family protein [Kiloniella litopenaei]|uniref:NADPH:quinone oxidoreductase family protein n=1 Tax=Kiloniella litopenaei TaxID=1549748 RepID=UPI000698CF01|nr:NADPH:quinone oxidoreductase family protein [Kiloniella litopenaei]